MQVILVRHGETAYNAQGIFQGYAPIPLSARGRQQAALVARRVASLRPTVLYSSDIARAHETAAIIGQHLDLLVQPAIGLREWNPGTWMHRPVTEYTAHLQTLGAHPVTYVPDDGESQLQTQQRIVACLQEFEARHSGETALGVSHGLAIDLLVRHILGLDVMRPPAYRIGNTSVNIFRCQDGVWEVVTLNDIGHLETLAE
jgi:alpha-ribazole phosphatase/probable phosphoglycerate mutase